MLFFALFCCSLLLFFYASLPRFLSSVPLHHRFFAELTLVAPGTERKGPELIHVMLNRRETISGKCRSENSILQCQKASGHAGLCGSVFYLCVCVLQRHKYAFFNCVCAHTLSHVDCEPFTVADSALDAPY